jgi:hypothetical protein
MTASKYWWVSSFLAAVAGIEFMIAAIIGKSNGHEGVSGAWLLGINWIIIAGFFFRKNLRYRPLPPSS